MLTNVGNLSLKTDFVFFLFENKCKKNHHQLLHKTTDEPTVKSISNNENSTTNCHVYDINQTLLKIIPIILKGPNSQIEIFALLDEGSTVSLIDSKIAEKLGLKGP